jgi:hypothetical protein
MGFIQNLENASVSKLAFYTAVSGTIAIICAIISNTYDKSPERFTTLGIEIIGILWTAMFGVGAFLKLINK